MKVYKFEAFTNAIAESIKEGIFKPGHKLPSVRDLKVQYQTSISTIQQGYEYLIDLGLVESIPKSGYYVRNRPDLSQQQVKSRQRPVVRDATFKHHLGLTTAGKTGHQAATFNVAAPGDLLMPQKLLLRTMQQVIREQGAGLLRYYPSGGATNLKEQILKKAAVHQTLLHPDELLITDGALQALYIALASVCQAGDVIAIESPCVFSVLEVIRVLQLRVIEVPVDTRSGFDIDFFHKACRSNNIKAVVVTPNFHNPTGTLLSDEQKQALLAVAQQHHVAIIENDIYGDLYFHGHRPSNIKSFDDSGLVLTYTSYAKTLSPGIRLGWLSAGKFMQRAEQIRFALGSTVSPLYQETVCRLLAGNSYDRHLRAFRMQLAKNAYMAINLLAAHFPENTTFNTPAGGYNIWVKMPDHTDMANFYAQCEKTGIRFTPGYTFSFTNAFDKYFRLVFADKFTTKRKAAIRKAGQLAL
ncbi:PLP-dependent aminotransferase family protein [Chitinophaga sp. Cy-1792]|uniref:aminotransferase-like domain-containing protein n=1 Tax=Chitinophaga sp. Cy-1792 TaxID=2608339 RepID=UPI001421226A|nr:PLP-dependent aminotransferase family protein [Chitinophaga sp. Cy-1792]NIG54883.1 PLP-dependent aminotransferase family protein [Chitinophaga sp. Cy-1792]